MISSVFHPLPQQIIAAVLVGCALLVGFRAWREKRKNLTGYTSVETVDDLIHKFAQLENWYASNAETDGKPLNDLILSAKRELRQHAPFSVHRLANAVKNPMAVRDHLPERGRTIAEFAEWASNKEREKCWLLSAACLYELKRIRQECITMSQVSFLP